MPDSVHDKPDAVEIRQPKGHVEFIHVDFSYDEKTRVARRNLT
jgi:hypothetical protein